MGKPGGGAVGKGIPQAASGLSNGNKKDNRKSLQEGKSIFLAIARWSLDTIQRDTLLATAAYDTLSTRPCTCRSKSQRLSAHYSLTQLVRVESHDQLCSLVP